MLHIPQDVEIGELVSPIPHPVKAKYHHTKKVSSHTIERVYSVRSESDPSKTYPVRIIVWKGEIRGVECDCPAHTIPKPPYRPKPCKHIAMALRQELLRRKEAHRYAIYPNP